MDRRQAAALALLGLGRGATRTQVVAAWRRAARELHPDRSTDPDAAGRFAELRAAYELARAATDERPADVTGHETGHETGGETGGETGDRAARPAPPQRPPRRVVRPAGVRPPAPPLVAGPVVVEPWPRSRRDEGRGRR